jgi:hypothetical protein
VSLLAAKNKAKNKIARIQNNGEKRLSRSPPATAASPIAFELLRPLKETNSAVPNNAVSIAATALSTPRRVATVRLPIRRARKTPPVTARTYGTNF